MKKIPVHPLCEMIPPMTEAEYSSLFDSIQEEGLNFPVVLYEGKILDGRHRYRACLELGIKPKTVEYKGDNPGHFVLAANIHRRHLTQSQKAFLIASVAQSKWGGDRTSAKQVATLPVARERLAEQAGVSERLVTGAKKVIDEAPKEIREAVRNGEMAVHTAEKVARAEQRKDEPVRCDTGATIPKPLLPMWERKGEVLALMKQVAGIENRVTEARDCKDTLYSTLDFTSIITKLQNIHQELRAAQLYAVCPTCNGRTPQSCKLCRGRGILSKFAWDSFVPEEIRRMKRV